MLNIVHALCPFIVCPYECKFCCAKDNKTNQNIQLTPDYWETLENSLVLGEYRNIMLTGDTEPTLFPKWLSHITHLANRHGIITELRTHNYNYHPVDVQFSQVWYSITDVKDLIRLPELYNKGKQFANEVNFAFLINKDFKAIDIIKARQILPGSKLTIRYLLDDCGNEAVAQWVRFNRIEFNPNEEETLASYNIYIKRNYLTKYNIIRQDGKIYYEWQ